MWFPPKEVAAVFGNSVRTMSVKIGEIAAASQRASRQSEVPATRLRLRHRRQQGYVPKAHASRAVAIAFVMGVVSTVGTVVLADSISESGIATKSLCIITRHLSGLTGPSINRPASFDCSSGPIHVYGLPTS